MLAAASGVGQRRPAAVSVRLLLLACLIAAAASGLLFPSPVVFASGASCALGSLAAANAAATAAASPAATVRALTDASLTQGSTVLFTGSPIRTPGFIDSFDLNLAVTPSRVILQLYSTADNGGVSTPTLTLKRSLSKEYLSTDAVGVRRVSVSWSVSPGDVFGFSVAAGDVPQVPFDDLALPANDTLPASANPQAWTTQFIGAPVTAVGQSITRIQQGRANRRIYSFAANLLASCDASGFSAACGLSPSVLAMRNQTDLLPGVSTLLVGLPVAQPDVLTGVSMLIDSLEPFYLQLWSPASASASWVVRQSVLYRPRSTGQVLVNVDWVVATGDVFGWSTRPTAQTSGPLAFDEDISAAHTSRVQQNDNQGAAPESVTTIIAANAATYYRVYAVQLYARLACNLKQLGSSQLLSSRAREDLGRTTLLVGQSLPGRMLLTSVTMLPLNLHPLVLQLWAADRTLKYSTTLTPLAVGVAQSSEVAWPLEAGDILGYRGDVASGTSSPIGFADESANANPAFVTEVWSQSLSVAGVGAGLKGNATDVVYQSVNLLATLRPYGLCSGAGFVPANGAMGTCGLLSSNTSSCAFSCADGYILSGSRALTCSDSSIGGLTGTQTCEALPCSFSLLASSNATMGTCNTTLASGTRCFVLCNTGTISLQSTSVACLAQVISTSFSQCVIPQSCTLPSILAAGAEWGNCTSAGVLAHGSSCTLVLTTGYALTNGSLTLPCYNGALPPLPNTLPTPCALPTLSANVQLGTCSPIMGSGAPNCMLECDYGYLPAVGSTALNCTEGILMGTVTTCFAAPSCALPITYPAGTNLSSCAGLTELSPLSGSCQLTILPGYTLVYGVPRYDCLLGDLRSNFSVIASPRTLPSLTGYPHTVAGTCATKAGGIPSGSNCAVACAPDYVSSLSPNFVCNFGALDGTLPQCALPACQLPLTLPDGLSSACQLGSLMRADGDTFPSSCLLSVAAGYVLQTGNLTLSCSRTGVLSPIPTVVRSLFPVTVSGGCGSSDGPQDWSQDSSPVPNLAYAGNPQCAAGQAIVGWKLATCATGGRMSFQITCAQNVMLSSSSIVTVTSQCFSGSAGDMRNLDVAACPALSTPVGAGFVSCNAGAGVQLSVQCRPMVSLSTQLSYVGLFSFPSDSHFRTACTGSGAGILADLATQVKTAACPINTFNYMMQLGFETGCSVPTQITRCTVFRPSVSGLAASNLGWFGPNVHERSSLDAEFNPSCVAMTSARIQTSGRAFAFTVWAANLGDLTVQTYTRNDKGEFVVRGSFTYTITQLGYQQVGIPASQGWAVTPEHYMGFCWANTPLVVGDPAGLLGTASTDPNSAHIVAFQGAPVAVGEAAGGGDDAGHAATNQWLYSFQLGVEPFPSASASIDSSATTATAATSKLATFGFGVLQYPYSDTLSDGNCLLLDQPRINILGNVTMFTFYAANNNGEVQLQTYREIPLYSGHYFLQGSVTVPTLYQGVQNYTLPASDQWQAIPGDLLAHCYTHSSIAFDWVMNPTDQWNGNGFNGDFNAYKAWNRDSEFNSPHWMSFDGDIQTQKNGPVLGGFTNGFSTHSGLGYVDRVYALELSVSPRSACNPLPAAAVNGHGTVVCDSLFCVLQCDLGYGAAKASQKCFADASWEVQGTCVPLQLPTFKRSWALPDLDPYSVRVMWQPPTLPSGILLLGWELQQTIAFPTNSDLRLPALKSLANTTGTFKFGATARSYVMQLDIDQEIEHVGVNAQLRMLVSGGTSAWIPMADVYAACACDMYRALQPSKKGLDSNYSFVQWGSPLDVSVQQVFGISNSLMLSFTPNSLCTYKYVVDVTAVDNTQLPVAQSKFDTYAAANAKSCGFMGPTTKQVTNVFYPLYGRDLKFCVTQAPRFICGTCQTEYNSGTSDNGATPPPTCVIYRPSFAVNIRGVVTTQKSLLSPAAAGVGGVKMTAVFLDLDTGDEVRVAKADGTLGSLTAEAITDRSGRYDFALTSDQLPERQYQVRISPSFTQYEASSGLQRVHQFVSSTNADINSTTVTVDQGAWLMEVDFFDLSVVPVLGSIQMPPSLLYGSDAFQGCGVFNITITVYAESDTSRANALSTSTATLNDGQFAVTAPIQTTVILVPSQEGVNRTFDPPFLTVQVLLGVTHADPIYDVTTSQLTLQIDGGNCGRAIGAVRPALYYDACGASAHILLPAFASGVGYTYTVPSHVYTVKLFDSQDAFSGLQFEDIDGTRLPGSYLNGPVFDFIATKLAPFSVDFSLDTLTPQSFPFRYFAIPDLTMVTPFMCRDPLALTAETRYAVLPMASSAAVDFKLTESYGYIGTMGENRVTTCGNVTAGIEFLDGVSNDALLQQYVDDYGCSTGSRLCTIPSVYNSKDDSTTLTYNFKVGSIQISNFQTDASDTAHTQPYFSRVILYRLAGSVLPFVPYYVVIVGSEATEGALSLVYPPWDAAYILRDPPGSYSQANLALGTELKSTTTLTLESSSKNTVDLQAGGGMDGDDDECVGPDLGFEAIVKIEAEAKLCTITSSWKAVGTVISQIVRPASTDVLTRQQANTLQFNTLVSTSGDPTLIDGDGDLFLTIDGSFSITMSNTVSVDIDIQTDPVTQAKTYTCTAQVKPTVVWKEDKGRTYQWITQWDIKNVLMADLKLINTQILQQFGAGNVTDLARLDTEGSQLAHYNANVVALTGWQGLLDYNQKLIAEADEWTDFYSSLSSPGASDSDHLTGQAASPDNVATSAEGKKVIKDLSAPAIAQASPSNMADMASTADSNNPNPVSDVNFAKYGTNLQHVSPTITNKDKRASSVTYYGDVMKNLVTFAVTATSTSSSERHGVATRALDANGGVRSETAIFSVNLVANAMNTYSLSISHGARAEFSQSISNAIEIALGDGEPGDMFHIQMYKDKAYGSPVYKTVSGQSRCPPEAGTVARENLEIIVGTPMFSHVNPDVQVSSHLTLINKSPTHEPFDYSLTVLQETNPHGLRLYLNGQVINSDAAPLTITVQYGINVVLTFVAEKGAAGYVFEDVALVATSSSPSGGGPCGSATAHVSVTYDQPCSRVAFAGALAVSGSFTVNSGYVLRSGQGAQLSVTIKNPEFTLLGRTWSDLADIGYLETLDIQYRPAATSGEVLSEADWQSIKRVGDTIPATPLLQVMMDGYTSTPQKVQNDFLSVTWDMASLADGPYQLRALTKCTIPRGTQDTSLYTDVTPAIRGTVDVLQPKLFGAPLPALKAWSPGQPISATLTKTLACNSFFGKAKVAMWINPTQVAGPKAQGINVDNLFVCTDNTISIQMYAPVYDQMVGRLISVVVTNLFDTSGNGLLAGQVAWNFNVAPFDASISPVDIEGLVLSKSLATLLARPTTRTLSALQAALGLEISVLVNAALDADLNPTPRASSSLQGLQPGSVLLSNVQSGSAGTNTTSFSLALQPMPAFPGDTPSPYSPSRFAYYLTRALQGQNHTNAPTTYPLLSLLTALSIQPATLSVQTRPMTAGKSSASTSAVRSKYHTMSASDYALMGFQAGVTSLVDLTATPQSSLQFQWLVSSSAAPNLAPSDLSISYMMIADATTDPDVAAGIQKVTLPSDGSGATTIRIVSNIQSARALYSLQLIGFPSAVGGFTCRFWISVSSAATPLYVVDETVFVVGPPSSPVLLTVAQNVWDELSLSFYPSARSGSSAVDVAGSEDVVYLLSLTSPDGYTTAVPTSLQVRSQTSVSGFVTQFVRVNLTNLAANASSTVVFPKDGLAANWTVGLMAQSSLAASPTQTRVLLVGSPPAQLSVYRASQLTLQQHLIRFSASLANAPTAYILAYRLNASYSRQWDVAPSSLTVVPMNASSSLPQMLDATIDVPASASGFSQLEFAVGVRNALGASPLEFQAAPSYAFVSAPGAVSASLVGPVSGLNATVNVTVAWLRPAVLYPVQTPSLLKAFRVSYSARLVDGALSTEKLLAVIDVANATQLQWRQTFRLPFSADLTAADYSRSYILSVRAQMYSTTLAPLLFRTDGTGMHVLESAPSTALLTVRPDAGSFNSNDTVLPPVAPSPIPASQYPLEGAVNVAAPAAPLGLQLSQMVGSPLNVRVVFVAVSGATRYQLSWFHSHVSNITAVGSVMVSAAEAIDGWMVSTIHKVWSAAQLQASGATLKVAIASVGPNGDKSQRVVEFLQVPVQASLRPHYTLQVQSANGFTLPARRMQVSGFQAWNVSIPFNQSLTIRVQPVTESQLRSVQIIAVTSVLTPDDARKYFGQCPLAARGLSVPLESTGYSSSASSTLSSIIPAPQTLSACNLYSFALPPTAVGQANQVVYMQLITSDWAQHYEAIHCYAN